MLFGLTYVSWRASARDKTAKKIVILKVAFAVVYSLHWQQLTKEHEYLVVLSKMSHVVCRIDFFSILFLSQKTPESFTVNTRATDEGSNKLEKIQHSHNYCRENRDLMYARHFAADDSMITAHT